MAVTMQSVIADIEAETAALRELIAPLPEGPRGWDAPTPAVGWAIRDQISHLAFFDDVAVRSATDPDGFSSDYLPMMADGSISPDVIAERYRQMPAADLLAWFDTSRAALVAAFADIAPATRLPWFGPPMSAAAMATARLMETWAHGLDVADALGAPVRPTARLKSIAHLGVRTRDFAFSVHGLAPPPEPFRVELTAPDGGRWVWGPEDAAQRVTGSALDFCHLVTRRRPRAELDVVAEGADAQRWLSIAQAFAGPPGQGR